MAVVKLKEVSVIGDILDLETVADICGRTNFFHVDSAMSAYADSPGYVSYNGENPYTEPLQQLSEATSKLKKTLELLQDRSSRDVPIDTNVMITYVEEIATKINNLDRTKNIATQKIEEYTSIIETMDHFVGQNINLDELNSFEFVKAHFGALPKESLPKLASYAENPNVLFNSCSSDEAHEWGVYFAPTTGEEEIGSSKPTANPFTRPLRHLNDAVSKLKKHVDLLSDADTKNIRMDNQDAITYAENIATKIDAWEKQKTAAERKLQSYGTTLTEMKHFVGQNLALQDEKSFEFVKARFGSMPVSSVDGLREYANNPNVVFTPCSVEGDTQWGVYFAPISALDEVDRVFSGLRFKQVILHEAEGTPEQIVDDLQAKYDEANGIFKEASSNLDNLWAKEEKEIQKVTSFLSDLDGSFNEVRRGGLQNVDQLFADLKFVEVDLAGFTGTPEAVVADYRAKREAELAIANGAESSIDALWKSESTQIQKAYTTLTEKNVYFTEICRNAAQFNNNFVIIGWIPAKEENTLRAALKDVQGIETFFEGGKEILKHDPPTKMKNAGIFRPFEFFVDMYGTPKYTEMDPTWFVAITYTIMFGIMFGDMGQGPLIAIAGYLMWKFGKLAIGKVLIPCGIAATFFGFLYGSVFGFEDWLNPIHQFFGIAGAEHGKLIDVLDPAASSSLVYATIAMGGVLIMFVMIMGIIINIKQHNLEHALFGPSGIAGLALYVGLVGLVCNIFLPGITGFGIGLPSIIWIIILIIIPIVVVFFREVLGGLAERRANWQPESWGDYIMQNAFEMIEVFLGYLSNTMSFLRVGAFILVHAGMMLVVMTLAEMVPGVGFWIIIILGNAFVMCFECLLVCIQVLRLQFYELFSRYYEGGGRKFTPVSITDKV